jgi:hypothetical protein
MELDPEFPVIFVTQEHYELANNEVIGTNTKFWFKHQEIGYCLYKQNKSQEIGQDWAEKVASELCKLLGLPHAIYYLADTILIFNRIPKNRISTITIEFAQKILELNQDRLLNLKDLLT